MSKNKINKNTIPEGFTLGLAIVDAIPVLFFGASMILVGLLISSIPFFLGALLCLFAGAAKVLWKVIVSLKRKNIWWLFLQMRIIMPLGMLLMLTGIIWNESGISFSMVCHAVCSLPSAIFFLFGTIGMVLMMIFAVTMDSADVRSNWIEQLTNGVAQCAFFVGLLLLVLQ